MALFPLAFLALVVTGWIAALFHRPIWGLLTYIFVYFNIPSHQWWGSLVPDLRWSLVSAGVLVASCLLHRDALSRSKMTESAAGFFLLLFFMMVAVTSLFSPMPEVARSAVYDFFRYVVIYYLTIKIVVSCNHYRMILAVMLGSLFYMAHAAQSTHLGGRLEGFGLADAPDSNLLAALVLLLAPFCVAFMFTEKGWKRCVPIIPFLYIANMFVLCRSRGAFVGLIAQLLLAFFLLRKKIGLIKGVLICLLIGSSIFYLMDPQYKNRLLALQKGVSEKKFEESSAGRVEIWKRSLGITLDFPFGSGGRTYDYLSAKYLPANYITLEGTRAAHNTFLKVLIEQGAIGLVFFILFLFLNFKSLYFILNKDSVGNKVFIHTFALLIGLSGFWMSAIFIDRVYFECVYIITALTVYFTNTLNNSNS